jgi:dihydrofolate reductase
MSTVIASITVSLDGFVAGPNDRIGTGLGEGGEQLHDWMFGAATDRDKALVEDRFGGAGAWIVGRTMHDVADGWGDDPDFDKTFFVVTHRPHETVVKGNTTFEFVTDGIEAALERARAISGGKHVLVLGGADLLRQYLNLGVVDELALTIAPLLLGSGTPLFDGSLRTDLAFERIDVVESPRATHLRYRVS